MSEELIKMAKEDGDVVLISAGLFDNCREFARYFPDRYFDIGDLSCLEAVARGLKIAGKKPIVVAKEGDFVLKF
jgi:transketolase C-terminal domain/subunit